MADLDVKSVIRVSADTSNASRGMKELANTIASAGDKADKAGFSITGMIKSVATGLGTFNQAFEGVNKIFDTLNKGLDTAINQQRMANLEKMLPVGTVDKFREATDKMIGRQDVLRLSVKGLTGDFKLSNEEMETVLKTSVALSQKTGEHADVIADKLLDALAKGVNKLDDYGISLDKTGDRQYDVNAAMSKFKDIIAENPVDEQTKSLMQMKDAIQELTAAMADMIAQLAKWGASAFRYGREFINYSRDLLGDTDTSGTAFEKQAAREANRNSMYGYRAAQGLLARARGYYAEGQRRDQTPYFQGLSDEDYANSFGLSTDGTLVDRYGTVGHKYEARKDTTDYATVYQLEHKYDYLRGGSIQGPLGIDQGQGVGQVRPLDVVIMGIGKQGSFTLLDRAGIAARGDLLSGDDTGALLGYGSRSGLGRLRQGGTSFQGGAGGDILNSQRQGTFAGYDPNDPTGSLSGAITKQNRWAGGAFDAGMAGALAGVEAMVNGQRSVGRAVAAASAQALRAKAIEWGVFAVGELAWGISDAAHLAPTAAAHFAAAAKFGAAATAAGLGAAALGALASSGGGGGGGGSGISAGGGYASPAGSGQAYGGGGQTVVINMGDGFYGDSEKTAKAVAQAVRQASRQGQRTQFSSTFSG